MKMVLLQNEFIEYKNLCVYVMETAFFSYLLVLKYNMNGEKTEGN